MATKYSGSFTEMGKVRCGFAAESSGLGCYQVCRQLEFIDIINITAQASEIAILYWRTTSPNLQRIQIILTLETKT